MAQLNTRPYRTVPARMRAGGVRAGRIKLITMYFVYVLYSESYQRYYVGMTHDLNQRLIEHNDGKSVSTKAFKPWSIVLEEAFVSRVDARNREKYLKSAAGRRWRKENIRPRGAIE